MSDERTTLAQLPVTFTNSGFPGKYGGECWIVTIDGFVLGMINAFAPEVDPWKWEGEPASISDGLTDAINDAIDDFVREERFDRRYK